MHHPLVLLSVHLEKLLGGDGYNLVVASAFLAFLGILLFSIYKCSFSKSGAFYGSVTLLLLAIHSQFMLDSNIEIIHSLEYVILYFLIFKLVGFYGSALVFTLPFMLIDEWYQLVLLYPDFNDYFDFNDILMDTYGCAIAASYMMFLGVKQSNEAKPYGKRPAFFMLCTIIVAVSLAYVTGILSFFKSDTALIVLNENNTEPFWRYHPTHFIYYHAMQPAEGIVAVLALYFFYLTMDRLRF